MAQTKASEQTSNSSPTKTDSIQEKKEIAKEIVAEAEKKNASATKTADVDTAKDLLSKGNRNLHCGEVVTAVSQLQEACRLLAAAHGETSDHVADAYLSYGAALLEMSRMESGVLGNALQGIQDDTDNDSADDSQVEDPDKVTGEEREKIGDQVLDAMTEDRENATNKKDNTEPASNGSTEKPVTESSKTNGTTNGAHTNGTLSATNGSSTDASEKDTKTVTEESAEPKGETEAQAEQKVAEEKMDTDEKENTADEKSDKIDTEATKDDESAEDEEGASTADEDKEDTGAESEDIAEGDESAMDEGTTGDEECGTTTGEDDPQEGGSKTPDEDEVSNLQLAWEMLELAKVIFSRGKSKELKLKASDAYMKLGEVGLETEQYEQAIGDLKSCLKIQQENLEAESRLIAETHYQIGLACNFCGRYDEAVEQLNKAVTVIETKLGKLQATVDSVEKRKKDGEEISVFDDPTPQHKKEIEELQDLLPDIKSKIEDTIEEKKSQEAVKEMVKQNLNTAGEGTSVSIGFGEQTSSPQKEASVPSTSSASDITHLVRKKRKQDEESSSGEESKKAKVDAAGDNKPATDKPAEEMTTDASGDDAEAKQTKNTEKNDKKTEGQTEKTDEEMKSSS